MSDIKNDFRFNLGNWEIGIGLSLGLCFGISIGVALDSSAKKEREKLLEQRGDRKRKEHWRRRSLRNYQAMYYTGASISMLVGLWHFTWGLLICSVGRLVKSIRD